MLQHINVPQRTNVLRQIIVFLTCARRPVLLPTAQPVGMDVRRVGLGDVGMADTEEVAILTTMDMVMDMQARVTPAKAAQVKDQVDQMVVWRKGDRTVVDRTEWPVRVADDLAGDVLVGVDDLVEDAASRTATLS